MIRRRFVTSAFAAVAGLFGLKAAKADRLEGRPVKDVALLISRHYACLRLSDGEVLLKSTNSKRGASPNAATLKGQCFPYADRVGAFSEISTDHAVELAQAARLRYVISSAMKAHA